MDGISITTIASLEGGWHGREEEAATWVGGGVHSLPTLEAGEQGGEEKSAQGLFAGRYLLSRMLGRGGMGTVYLARDMARGEQVALKVLRARGRRSAVAEERFRREARFAQRISHQNVARVYEMGRAQGRIFLTLEYVEGEDLKAHLEREGALAPDEAVRLALAVCEGLEAAHSAGVVHRDLKPANVLLGGRERVVLTDFGIARAMEEVDEGSLTGTHGMVGTPQYMAPEQLTEEPVDARTDVYAVGLLLYEMLVGEPAFQHITSLKAAYARLRSPVPDPRERRAVPTPLAELVRHCLSLAPQQRPANARLVASVLEDWLH